MKVEASSPGLVRALLAVGAALLAAFAPASAAPAVRTPAELDAAVASARGGETISLAPGEYGEVRVFNRNYAAPVTIRSADPGRPARMRRFRVIGSRNVNARGLDIGAPLGPDDKEWTRVAEITNSSNITLANVRVHGSLDGDPRNDGWGLFIRQSSDIQVLDSEFTELALGILSESVDRLEIRRNRFHVIQRDGADFAGSSHVTIEDNRFSNFMPKDGAHPDAIQFWTARQTKPSTDIVIRGNIVLQGHGGGMQGIFLGNEIGLRYRRVTIENNFLYSAVQYHGIMVDGADELRIAGNTVVSPPDDVARYWIRVLNTKDGVVERNVTDDITLEKASPRIENNIVFSRKRPDRRFLRALAAGAAADPLALILPGHGYQPPNVDAR